VSGQLHAPAVLPHGKSPWYPLARRLGGPQRWFGHGREEKNSLLHFLINNGSAFVPSQTRTDSNRHFTRHYHNGSTFISCYRHRFYFSFL